MDNSRSKHFSTLVGNCPSCTGYVRVPLDARSDATARCPHCTTTFSVSDVLEQIPELEIVESAPPEKAVPLVDRQPIARPVVVERKKFEVPRQLVAGAKKKRRRKEQPRTAKGAAASAVKAEFPIETVQASSGRNSEESGVFDPLSVTISPEQSVGSDSKNSARSISSTNAARVRVHSSQRHRRMREERKSSPGLEVIKVVLGGLMAFPIAYLILLWGVGQDPLRIAPIIGQAAPFAVPKSFLKVAEPEKPKPRRFRAITGESNKSKTAEAKEEVKQEPRKLEVPKLDIGADPRLIPGELEREILSVPDVAPGPKSPATSSSKKN